MDGTVKIKSGEHEVLSSGSFLTFSGLENRLDLTYKNESITIYISFLNDPGNDKPELRTEFELVSNTGLRFKFYNYNHTTGQFIKTPYEIGTIAHRRLFMAFYCVKLRDTDRHKISFTFYLGEEVQNG
jgi:hypothetical protein